MSCKAQNIIDHLKVQLGDPEGTRYTDEMMLAWLNLAVLEVAGNRPDLFAQPKTVTLTPGCVQNFCNECEHVTAILYTHGNECVEPVEEDEEEDETNICDFLGDDPCFGLNENTDPDDPYAIEFYTLDQERPCFLRVKGDGVPDDGTPYTAEVMCVEKPNIFCIDDDLPDCMCGPYLACITWSVMARAAAQNTSAASSLARSQQYLQNFYGCLTSLRDAYYALENPDVFLRESVRRRSQV